MNTTDNLTIDPALSADGARWVWPDGTSVPHVRGGSDLTAWPDAADAPPTDAPPPADAPPPDAPAADAPPPADAPPADAGDDAFYEGWPEQAIKAHKDLKGENVKYKERFRPFEETFGGLHEDDQGFLLGFVDAFRAGDEAELARYAGPLRAYLDKMTPAEQQQAKEALAAAAAAPAGAEPEWDPFDPEAIDKRVEAKVQAQLSEHERARAAAQAAQDREAAVAKATNELIASAASLAETHKVEEWADPTSALYAALVSVARRQEGESSLEGKMAKAAELYITELERRGQAMMKAKLAAAGAAPAPSGGDEPSGRKEPLTIKDAEASALARLEGLQLGPTGR